MDIIIEILKVFTLPIIVVGGTAFFLFKASRNEKLIRPCRSQKVLFGFLILWTLIGFFTQLDFTDRCLVAYSRGVFSPDYVIFSAISLILLLFGLLNKNKILRFSLLCIELAYWTFKLFALKSGYLDELGYMVFFYYDFFGLLGRFLLLNSILGNKLKEYLISLVAGLLIMVKFFIPCNENTTYKYYIDSYYNNLLFQDINGSWSGSMLYPKDSSIYKTIKNPDTILYGSIPEVDIYLRDTTIFFSYKNVDISFNDSSLAIKKAAPELNGKYWLLYSRPIPGFLVYHPSKFINDNNRSNIKENEHSIMVIFGIVSDSTLSFRIHPRTELKLKKSR